MKRGVKEVVKAIRKKQSGCAARPPARATAGLLGLTGRHCRARLCIIAGDISPIDVISHVPVLCEDAGISYCYVSSKQELGAAGRCALARCVWPPPA